jgi:hypothetical protein
VTNPAVNAIASAIAGGLALWRASPASRRFLELEQVLALDAKRRLCVVRCGSRRLLLLTGGASDLSLGWLSDEAGTPGDRP